MKYDWKKLASEVVASLSENEREESIAYLEQRVIPAGEALPWPEITQTFNEPIVIAFIDLEPALNWTHRGRYLLLGVSGGIRQKVDVNSPPFLKGVSPYLRLIHEGRQTPSWASVASVMNENDDEGSE